MEFIKVKNQIFRISEIANIKLEKDFARINITLKGGKETSICYQDPSAKRIYPNKEEMATAEAGFEAIWNLLVEREA